MKLWGIAAILAATFAFACGGDDDSEPDATDDGSGGSANGAATQSNGDSNAGTGSAAENTAVVVVDGQRYEFALLSCVAIGGAVGGVGRSGQQNIQAEISLPPANWESSGDDWTPPAVRVRDDVKDVDWRAGGDIVESYPGINEGQSQVDSYKIDGKRASGSATFIDFNKVTQGNLESVKGTFEIACK